MVIISRSIIENFTKEELQNLLDTSLNYKEVLTKMGLSAIGNNYNTLNKFIRLYELSTDKIDIKRKQSFNVNGRYRTKENLLLSLKENTCSLKSNKLLKYLIKYEIKEYKCERCGISEWNNLPITLELHHKNGKHGDNNLENLEVLCPNCHSQTDTFRFKNKKHDNNKNINTIRDKKTKLCPICNTNMMKPESKMCRDCYNKSKGKETVSKQDLCPVCNTNYKSLISEMCQECRSKERGKNIPTKETVKNLIRNKPFTQIGEMFNVSDNAIRKWCKKYGLPYKASDIKKLSDDEWKIL